MQKTFVAVLVDTAHVAHPDRIALEGAPMRSSGQLTLDRSTLEKLHHHATSAARIVGHLDHPVAAGPLGEHVDAITHELTEILGEARTLAALDAAAPDVAHDGAPMLASSAGGAP